MNNSYRGWKITFTDQHPFDIIGKAYLAEKDNVRLYARNRVEIERLIDTRTNEIILEP